MMGSSGANAKDLLKAKFRSGTILQLLHYVRPRCVKRERIDNEKGSVTIGLVCSKPVKERLNFVDFSDDPNTQPDDKGEAVL